MIRALNKTYCNERWDWLYFEVINLTHFNPFLKSQKKKEKKKFIR